MESSLIRIRWKQAGGVLGMCLHFCAVGCGTGGDPRPVRSTEVRMTEVERHVRSLAEEIGERNLDHPDGLERAARYIEGVLSRTECRVGAQRYRVGSATVRNIEAELPGLSREFVLVGAHYDSAPGSPGADDNATGVAALLELARCLSDRRFQRGLRFVAFVNEEPPYFATESMGSRVYARRARQRDEPIAAMLSLETIGYYSDRPRSQQYPFPLNLYYPDRGNFLGFIGNLASRAFVARLASCFRKASGVAAESAAVPEWVPGVGLSDHWAFWQAGYRAVMITDTAMFRYPYYHTPEDEPDKLDFGRLGRVVEGLREAVAELAGPVPAR